MELITAHLPKASRITIAPLGDIQWSGEKGPTAQERLKRHIGWCLEQDAYFVGLGDYIDALSPSNRARLQSANLYDTAKQIIWDKALELTETVYEKFLKDTKGRWLGKVEGHHFYEFDGEHTDEILANKLKAPFLGTSAFIRIPSFDVTLWVHHGAGGGVLPGPGLNRLYHVAAGLQGADIYMMGHNTKIATTRLSRPYPIWGKKNSEHRLEHRDIWLVNCGGFSKSNIVGHCLLCGRPRGDYAEQGLMTPSPLTAPLIHIDMDREPNERIRVAV